MPVNPQIQEILDFIAARNAPPLHTLEPPQARIAMAKARALVRGDEVTLARVENRGIPGPAGRIPLRLYADSSGTPLPMLLYLHGGGFVIGDLESHDDVCRHLARAAGCLVIAADYRLAPEHPFPAGLDDSFAAAQWVVAHALELGGDPTRLAVGGDSAGANLATVVTLLARDRGGPAIRTQLLVYPVTAHDLSARSMHDNAQGYFLTVDMIRYFMGHYLRAPGELEDPRVSPLKAANLAGLPPAYVLTAAYDPLCDEGRAYALRLRAAGVPVAHRHYDDAVHGFFTFTKTALARQAIDEAAAHLRMALALE
ncbi:MAG: alpha/beta hydrolase [Candidatus Lambdaproteobacteria bacterium]|nr:alpha/beta hydrolase [Candidatus Lambdaproteobacteria bacterium]